MDLVLRPKLYLKKEQEIGAVDIENSKGNGSKMICVEGSQQWLTEDV